MKKLALSLFMGVILASVSLSVYAAQWQSKPIGKYQTNIYVPDSLSPVGNGRSLMLNLHGCSQTHDHLLDADWQSVADEWGMVVVLPFSTNQVLLGCYPYASNYGMQRTTELANFIELTEILLADSDLNIDANQVYVSGLSAGGGFAMFAACSHPEIFAGVGLDATPAFIQLIGATPNSPSNIKSTCESLATDKTAFATQIMSTANGTSDNMVNFAHAEANATAYAMLYGVETAENEREVNTLSPTATESVWKDSRISKVIMNNVIHAWPGGENSTMNPGGFGGIGGNYVDNTSINYGMYLADFFAENNLRVDPEEENTPPKIDSFSVSADEDSLLISGKVSDKEDSSSALTATLEITNSVTDNVEVIDLDLYGGSFSDSSQTNLENATYWVKLIVEDSKGESASQTKSATVDVEPENQAPVVTSISADVADEDCIQVSGAAKDNDGSVSSVNIRIKNKTVSTTVSRVNNTYYFEYQQCGYESGSYAVSAVAVDNDAAQSARSQTVTVVVYDPIILEGDDDGDADGSADGDTDGSADGDVDGSEDGDDDTTPDGDVDGSEDGDTDGSADGDTDGSADGDDDTTPDGDDDTTPDGDDDTTPDGDDDDIIIIDEGNTPPPSVGGGSTGIALLAAMIMLISVRRRR